MSEHKQVGVVGSTSAGMIHVGGKKSPRLSHVRIWVLGSVVVLLLAVGICGLMYALTAKPKPTTSNTSSNETYAYNQAVALSLNGHPGPLQTILNSQLKEATTAAQKVDVYNQQMALDINEGRYNDAISLGQEADDVQPTSDTADLVANAYEAEGNNAEARVWVQKAINLINKNSPTYQEDLESYTNELAGLPS